MPKDIELFGADKASERWTIEQLAARHREKWPPEAASLSPGYQTRSARDWYELGNSLAEIQVQYDASPDVFPRHLMMRALMLLWPKFLDPVTFYSKNRPSSRNSQSRETAKVFVFQLFNMAAKKFPSVPGVFDVPRIKIHRRSRSERPKETNAEAAQNNKETADEVIGRAVLLEYRRLGKLEAALVSVAAVGSIDGISTGGRDNVSGRYHAFRKLAEERGYADGRAFWCAYDQESWPTDQIWLEDFPTIKAVK